MPGMAGAEQGLSHMQQVIYWAPKSSVSGNATWSPQILPGPFHTETPQMEMSTVGPTVGPTVSAVAAQDAQRSEVQVLQAPVEASCTLVTPCSTEVFGQQKQKLCWSCVDHVQRSCRDCRDV